MKTIGYKQLILKGCSECPYCYYSSFALGRICLETFNRITKKLYDSKEAHKNCPLCVYEVKEIEDDDLPF